MGKTTDKIQGRAKQAVGSVTGDQETKREGERQEAKGKLKGNIDSAIDRAQDALADFKDKADDAVDALKDKIDRKSTAMRARENDATRPVVGRARLSLRPPRAGRIVAMRFRTQTVSAG